MISKIYHLIKLFCFHQVPLILHFIDASAVGSVAVCEMLYRTNILAIVGGGRKQKFAENTGNSFINIQIKQLLYFIIKQICLCFLHFMRMFYRK